MYLSNIIVSEKKTSLKYTIRSDVNYNFDENKLRNTIYICESVLEELKLKGYNAKIEKREDYTEYPYPHNFITITLVCN